MSASSEWYELRSLVFNKKFKEANNLLRNHADLTSEQNGIGETVLHFLAVENEIDGVKWLYEKGFDINSENDFGQSVLFEVAALEYKELFSWLVEKGADLSHRDKEGDDIIKYLEGMEKKEFAKYVRETYT